MLMDSYLWSKPECLGPDDRAPLCSAEHVLQNANVLYCIAKWLTPRGRLVFTTLSRPCADSVAVAEFWQIIRGSIIESDGPGRKIFWSYSEAAQFGNRLGCVLRQFGRFCTRLYLANSPWLQVTGLEDLARCTNLVHLDMSGCSLYSVDLLGHLVRHCPSLRSLVARECVRICEPEIIQELFDAPLQCRLNLEHMDLQGVLFVQDHVLSPPRNQEGFHIHSPHLAEVSDLGRAVRRLASDRLVTLRLGWAGEAREREALFSQLAEVLAVAGQCGGTLRLLDLAGCCLSGRYDSPSLVSCLSRLTALRVLCLSNLFVLADTGQQEPTMLPLQPQQLQQGQAEGQRGWAVGRGLQCCPTTQLQHLNLRGVRSVHDVHLRPLLASNPGLLSLNLGCTSYLSDNTLYNVSRHCRALTSLDVCYAASMTAQGVRAVSSSLPALLEFGFSGFPGLRDDDIANLVARMPGLRSIGIGGIPGLTDAALHSIAAGCPSLESLYGCRLPNITLDGVEALIRGCVGLKRLALNTPGDPQGAGNRGGGGGGVTGLRLEMKALLAKYSYKFDGDMLPYDVVREENEYLLAV